MLTIIPCTTDLFVFQFSFINYGEHPSSALHNMKLNCTVLRFTSKPCNVKKVIPFLEKISNAHKLHSEKKSDVLVSITEAVNNAILHGNGCDEKKIVEIHAITRGNVLSFTVSDQGNGFDYNNLPDPTSFERLCECGGRGVFLMRQLSNACRFQNNGRTVSIDFQIA